MPKKIPKIHKLSGEEPRFLFNEFLEKDRAELERIARISARRPKSYDKAAVFLKQLGTAMFKVHKREWLEKVKREKIKVVSLPPKPKVVKKPPISKKALLKPKLKEVEVKLAPPPMPEFEEEIHNIIIGKETGNVLAKAIYNKKTKKYELIEPELSEKDVKLLAKLEKKISKKILHNKTLVDDKTFMTKHIGRLCKEFKIPFTLDYYEKIRYYLVRNILAFDKVNPLLKDPFVKEIICDGLDQPLHITYEQIENVGTNVVFRKPARLNALVERFARVTGKKVSEKVPFLATTLPSGPTVQAALASELTPARFIIKK